MKYLNISTVSVSLIDEGSKLIDSFGDGIIKTQNSNKNAIIDLFTSWLPDWMKSGMKKVGIDAVRASAGLGEDGPEAVILLILFCYQPRLRGLKNS